jgi:DNA-nicking Smr family endonuclease
MPRACGCFPAGGWRSSRRPYRSRPRLSRPHLCRPRLSRPRHLHCPLFRLDAPPPGLDRGTWQKFRTGRARAARVLDLHGMTAARAHAATLHFVLQAHAQQLRVVEIITGKGEVLLRELPHWLNSRELRPLILALAHPHAANTGSVLVLLRRTRTDSAK